MKSQCPTMMRTVDGAHIKNKAVPTHNIRTELHIETFWRNIFDGRFHHAPTIRRIALVTSNTLDSSKGIRIVKQNVELLFLCEKQSRRFTYGREARQVELEENGFFTGRRFQILDSLVGFCLAASCEVHFRIVLQKSLDSAVVK